MNRRDCCMQQFRRLCAAILPLASVAVFACSASAAEWSGLYIGGHAGVMLPSVSYDHVETVGAGGAIRNRQAFDTDGSEFSGGAQIGIQQQFGGLVGGIEVGYSWQDISEGQRTNLNNRPRNRITDIGDMWTIAGRLGFPMGSMLPYVKIGYANAELGFRNILLANGALGGASSKREDGLLLGAGIEWAFARNWSAGIDYTYVNLDPGRHQQFLNGVPVAAYNDSIEADLHQVTARINYRFDWTAAPQ